MKNYDNIQDLVERADQRIRLKATGTPNEFAAILGISRASLFRLLEEFKILGAPIRYCDKRISYYYEYPVKIEFSFRVLKSGEISKEEMNKIGGGNSFSLNHYYTEDNDYFERNLKNLWYSLKI